LNIVYTKQFKKDCKRKKKQNKNLGELWKIVGKLMRGEKLPAKCRDHSLHGRWKNYRDCHIQSDWLVIYRIHDDDLILIRTGSHSELFS